MKADRFGAMVVAAWLVCAGPASATLMQIEASYDAPGPGGGTASVTGIYDDVGFTGAGTEIFYFLQVHLVFSATGGSFLAGTSHTRSDMFGVAFQNGAPVDLVNYNNTIPGENKSQLIFSPGPGVYPGSVGIYMADSGTSMDIEPWWVVNHQDPQRHSLSGFNEPQPASVPEPGILSLLAAVLVPLALFGRR